MPTSHSPYRRREFGQPAPLEPRPMADSLSTITQVMLPNDANPMGNVHGGAIMKMVDVAAAVSAMRHCGRQVVTVALDHMSFLQPVFIGDLVTITSQVEYVGRTSMLVRAHVEAESPTAPGKRVLTSASVLTFVALGEDGHTMPVPPLLAETAEERARLEEGRRIYENAKAERTRQAEEMKAQELLKTP